MKKVINKILAFIPVVIIIISIMSIMTFGDISFVQNDSLFKYFKRGREALDYYNNYIYPSQNIDILIDGILRRNNLLIFLLISQIIFYSINKDINNKYRILNVVLILVILFIQPIITIHITNDYKLFMEYLLIIEISIFFIVMNIMYLRKKSKTIKEQ